MSDEASAVPDDLTKWAYWASGLNNSLHGRATDINKAIRDFNSAPQEPRFVGTVEYVGNDMIGYAARNSVIDDWVGQVGRAFIQADHKGVSPQVYRANREDFATGLNTASETDLARLVGDDPVKLADDAANGAELAAQLKQAEDTQDEGRIRAILGQLQGQSQEFAYRFFTELGPDQTIKTLIVINHMQDDGLLQTFDNALGQATQHPSWDPNFTSALLDPRGQAWGMLPNTGVIQLSMLKYGTFSEDFLTRSADYFLFSGKDPAITGNKGLVVFNALDRNPNAAYNYLTGHVQGIGDENLARVQYLLRHSNMDYNKPDENTALGNLIADAGLSGNGRADNGKQLLQDIGSIGSQGEVEDHVRPGIERLLTQYIGNFATYTPPEKPTEGQFPWQIRLFMIAEMNADGSVDEGRMTDLQNAATKWLASQMTPMDDGPTGEWFGQAGTLYGLTLLPAKKAGWNNYDMEKASAEFWKTTIEYATGFLPEWAHKLEDIPLTTLSSIGRSYLDAEPGGQQTKDWEVYNKAQSRMVPAVVMALAARDPNFLPPNLRGLPLNDPQVSAYINPILTSVAEGNKNPIFDPPLKEDDPVQLRADAWANAITRMPNSMRTIYDYPVDGYE